MEADREVLAGSTDVLEIKMKEQEQKLYGDHRKTGNRIHKLGSNLVNKMEYVKTQKEQLEKDKQQVMNELYRTVKRTQEDELLRTSPSTKLATAIHDVYRVEPPPVYYKDRHHLLGSLHGQIGMFSTN